MTFPLRICVAVCTYKRPDGIKKALESIGNQQLQTPANYQVRIVVVDNNDSPAQTAAVIQQLQPSLQYPVLLLHEPRKGISEARNRAVQEALNDDALLFIDDDEEAMLGWLDAILTYWQLSGTHIVNGPVIYEMQSMPRKKWVHHIDAFQTRILKTGTYLSWGYTSNILIDRKVFDAIPAFDTRFSLTGGEDGFFIAQAIRRGLKVRWCAEAAVRESVPPSRTVLKWILRRAYRIGSNEPRMMRYLGENPWSRAAKTFLSAIKNAILFVFGVVTADVHLTGKHGYIFVHRIGFLMGVLLGVTHKEYQ